MGTNGCLCSPRLPSSRERFGMHRAGVGWSDPPFAPRTSTSIADDLHELLHRASVAPPYVLVGSSIGGEYARVFTAKYPTEVAGLVLVDSSHPDQHEPPRAKGPASRLPIPVREFVCLARPAMVLFGIVRWMSSRSRQYAPSEMSSEQQKVFSLLKSRPTAAI